MEKLKVGFIGCGGRANAHFTNLLKMDDVQIVAVADPVEERRNSFAQRAGVAPERVYPSHKELYDNENAETIDALIIAIEPTAHTDTELRAIEYGIPFLVEKPMTMDLELADKIVAGIKEKNLVTAVGFQDRYLDLVLRIKEEIPKHKPSGLVYGAWIGGIPGVWWWQKKSTCGGQLVEQNIHLLDGLRYLYGEPLSVYATASTGIVEAGKDGVSPEYDTDDHSTCVLRFPNNVTATLVSACYSTEVRPNCGYVVTFPDMVMDYRLRNNMIITTKDGSIDIPRGNDQTFDLDVAFLKAVREKNPAGVKSPYEDALKTLKLAFAANESMETGQVIYF